MTFFAARSLSRGSEEGNAEMPATGEGTRAEDLIPNWARKTRPTTR